MTSRVVYLFLEEPLRTRLSRQVFQPAGYEVRTAGESEEPPTLLVVDVNWPQAATIVRDAFPAPVVAYLSQTDKAAWQQVATWQAVAVLPPQWTPEEARHALTAAEEHWARLWHWAAASPAQTPWLHFLDRLPVGVLWLTPAQEVLWANHTAYEWLGCAPKRTDCLLQGELQSLLSQIPPQTTEIVEIRGEVYSPTNQILRGYGLHDPLLGIVVFLQDVSRLRAAERQRTELVQRLTLQLRSLMTAVLGYAELLGESGPLNETQRTFLQRLQQQGQIVTKTLNNLLELSRIEVGLGMQVEPVPLSPLLHYTIETMRPRAEAKGVTFVTRVPPDLPAVQAPPDRLRRVFDHLVGDAVRYTSPGGRVTLSAWTTEDQVIVQVQDTGIGIPREELDRIFEKFYRASNVRERYAGSGLGLPLVRSVLEQIGGRIWVESSEGHGATFTVILPVATSPIHPVPESLQKMAA